MRLDEEPQQVFRLVSASKPSDHGRYPAVGGYGRPDNFAGELEKLFPLKAESIPLVSTMHAQANRKAMISCSLREVYVKQLKIERLHGHLSARESKTSSTAESKFFQPTDSFHFRPFADHFIPADRRGLRINIIRKGDFLPKKRRS